MATKLQSPEVIKNKELAWRAVSSILDHLLKTGEAKKDIYGEGCWHETRIEDTNLPSDFSYIKAVEEAAEVLSIFQERLGKVGEKKSRELAFFVGCIWGERKTRLEYSQKKK